MRRACGGQQKVNRFVPCSGVDEHAGGGVGRNLRGLDHDLRRIRAGGRAQALKRRVPGVQGSGALGVAEGGEGSIGGVGGSGAAGGVTSP